MRALTYRTEIVIRRAPEDVFEFCSDLRSELQWNPKVKYMEKLTDGPVGVGTRYRAPVGRLRPGVPSGVVSAAASRSAGGRPGAGL